MRKTNIAMFTKYQAIFLAKALKQTKAGPRSSGTFSSYYLFLLADPVISYMTAYHTVVNRSAVNFSWFDIAM